MDIIQSKKEMEKKERNDRIVSMYGELVQQHPTTKQWRILRTLAEIFDLTPEGVKYVLVTLGVYKSEPFNHPKC